MAPMPLTPVQNHITTTNNLNQLKGKLFIRVTSRDFPSSPICSAVVSSTIHLLGFNINTSDFTFQTHYWFPPSYLHTSAPLMNR
jgi:hypothetical protein